MTSNSNPDTQVYLGWANSVLCEAGVLLTGLDDLKSGVALATIVDILWPDAQLSVKVQHTEQKNNQKRNIYNIGVILEFLYQIGVTTNLSAKDVACGSEVALVDLIWLLAFHLSICPSGSAPSEHSEEAGVLDLLEWCLIMLPGVTVDMQQGLAANMCGENLLVHLISQFCPVEEDEDAVGLLMNAMLSAEDYLGISKYIIDPLGTVAGSAPDRHLMLYLALLRRKSQQIEEMGPYASNLMGSKALNETSLEEAVGSASTETDYSTKDQQQQLLDMLGQEPITEEMMQRLQEQFGPIEIEIVEESSEESIDPGVSHSNIEEAIEVDDYDESGSFNVWPQQPIRYDSMPKTGNVPLLMELEQAEEVERLSQDVSRPHDQDSEEGDNDFDILGANMGHEHTGPDSHLLIEGEKVQGLAEGGDSQTERERKSRPLHKAPSGALKPPWLSPVPFCPPDSQNNSANKSADNGIMMHSTPRTPHDKIESTADEDESYQNYDPYKEIDEGAMYEAQPEDEYEQMEVDLENLTKDEIQELLMSAQMEGIPFDPKLIDLAAAHGLEFEIVMEDEDGNVIDGFPGGQPMTSSNFADLVQEIRAASGQDMEMSLQYDSGMGTGTGVTTGGTDNGNSAGRVNIQDIQQEIQQHLGDTGGAEGEIEYTNMPYAPTTSLEDLSGHGKLRQVVEEDSTDCRCPETQQEGGQTSGKGKNRQTTQHFHNSDINLGEKKKYSTGQYFGLLGERAVYNKNNPGTDGSNGEDGIVLREHDSDDNDGSQRQDSAKSSDNETDNENDERHKYSSNRSDKSFSSNTSVDGVIDTRADLDESEEEIVITMEVPGIPTDDGGFIIDMSKMFIPISIPGQGGDQEITVEIDPSNFDFSNMVQNADGTIEVDIEREVHNWMAKSASKFVHYSSTVPSPSTDNVVYTSPSSSDVKTTGQYDNCDAEVNSAIRAAITEQLHFPNKSGSDDSRHGPTIRPLSETPSQQDSSSRVSADSSSSLFDVSPAEDEVLLLLEQIGKHGQEMRKELQNSQQREIGLYEEKSQEEVRLAATVTLLEKELNVVRTENKKLYKQINSGKSTSKRDTDMIHRLESAMEDVQNRLHAVQRENTNLKKVNATLERRSKLVMHKYTMTESFSNDHKTVQAGASMFKSRQRGVQTITVHKADFALQQDGHHFMRNAITSTHDPIFRSLRSKTHGTQTDTKIIVDRGVVAMSTQEKLWLGSVAHAATQVRAVSKQHESVITRKAMRDASTITVSIEPERRISPIPKLNVSALTESPKPEAKYPWHNSQNQEPPRRSSTPIKASQQHRPIPVKPAQREQSTAPPLKTSSQSVDRLFTQIQGDSPAMENSATESMDTDEEPEGPDKWQRLSSMQMTSDPTVIKLQRSLASATMENDLLQTKMKKAKDEMSTRLGEWADLLAASKIELKQAKHDTVDLSGRQRKNPNINVLHQKIKILEESIVSAHQQSPPPSKKYNSSNSQRAQAEEPQVKVSELQNENSLLKSTLGKIKQEKEQLVKACQAKIRGSVYSKGSMPRRDFAHLRQHHRHSIEAVTDLESSVVGMTSERQNLQKEVQVLRDEYLHLKKGMELMERYFNADILQGSEDSDARSTSSQAPSVVEDVVKESEAALHKLKESDKVTQQSEAVLNALKDHDQDEVVVIPSGGVEGSLHKHISALAARIQSELGIKVQLVGEVDPAEILGASIHSQEGHTTSTPTPSQEDLTSSNAVEHLFQSVRPEGVTKPKSGLMDLQDVEDIIARAIPSPRETSPASPRGGSHQEKTDIEGMDAAELRRKRLGMFVDSYTKPRATSPESRVSSPRGRSPSPTSSRKTSPLARQQEMTLEDLEVASHGEPSTDHHTKMHRESRHQIQSTPPWASQSRSNSPDKTQEPTQKQPETIRKKLTPRTPLLPSKFSMTSVGVQKPSNGAPSGEESVQSSGHTWTQPKWRPFSRLAKTARLKQEVRPPSRGPSRAEMEAEAASIQDDILSRYAGEMVTGNETQQEYSKPVIEHTVTKVTEQRSSPVRKSRSHGIARDVEYSETNQQRRVEKEHRYDTDESQTTSRAHRSQPVPQKRQSLQNQRKYASQERYLPVPPTQTPLPENGGRTVFKDYNYTDYLLAKYGGDEEGTDTPQSDHNSDFQSSSPFSTQENGEMSTSDSDGVSQRVPHNRRWANVVHTPSEPRPSPVSRPSSAMNMNTVPLSPRSSRTSATTPRADTNGYHTRQEAAASPQTDLHSDLRSPVTSKSDLTSSSRSPAYSSSTSRTHSRPDVYSRSNPKTDFGSSIHADAPRSSTRPQSSLSLRTERDSRSPHRTEASRPWHTSQPYTSYSNPDPPKPESRSYYSDYLDKHEAEDKYWTEPKNYDYRHGVSTAWTEPKRHDTWRESDRLWPDSTTEPAAAHSTAAPYARPSSRTSYDSYTSTDRQTTSPYQSMADRYRFSTRTEPERETSASGKYYHRTSGTTAASSVYNHGYDRPSSAVPQSSRSYISRSDELTSVPESRSSRPLTSSTDYRSTVGSPASASSEVLRPRADDSFINGILEKYSVPSPGGSFTGGLGSSEGSRIPGGLVRPAGHTSSSYLTDLRTSNAGLYGADIYTSPPDLTADPTGRNRYNSSRDSNYPNRLDSYAEVSGFPAAYGRYSSTDATPDPRPRDRRSEIEDLLNKYAPLH